MSRLRAGRIKVFQENASMMGFLMTESKSPIIHVNTLFSDAWQTVCNLTPTAYAAMSANERADVRTKTGQRLDLEFLLEWSPYFSSKNESRLGVPEWASLAAMMKPLVAMPPWVAAWYRTIRKMVRIKQRDMECHEDAKGDSPLAQMFYTMTNQAPLMDRQMFEAWAVQSGHTTSTIQWLSKQMTRMLEVRPAKQSNLSSTKRIPWEGGNPFTLSTACLQSIS
jgi:hypothetical protein